jgi:hypothetical protein
VASSLTVLCFVDPDFLAGSAMVSDLFEEVDEKKKKKHQLKSINQTCFQFKSSYDDDCSYQGSKW